MAEPREMERELQSYGFFTAMDEATRDLIAGCARNVVFNKGEFIYREGDPANEFYVIRHGTVALEVHVPGRDALVIETLEEGEILGWSWLVPPYRSRFDARAVGLVRVICFDAVCLRDKIERDHEVGYQFYRQFVNVMTDRLVAARMQVIDMYGHPRDYLGAPHAALETPSKPARPGPGKHRKRRADEPAKGG